MSLSGQETSQGVLAPDVKEPPDPLLHPALDLARESSAGRGVPIVDWLLPEVNGLQELDVEAVDCSGDRNRRRHRDPRDPSQGLQRLLHSQLLPLHGNILCGDQHQGGSWRQGVGWGPPLNNPQNKINS